MAEDHPSRNPGKKSWLERVAEAFAGEPKDREELKEILNDAHENEILDKEAFRIIEGALNVSELHVRDIMIPRSQMISVESGKTIEEILPNIIESGHSRFPVIGENSDEVIGVLLAKDLLSLGSKTKFNTEKMSKQLKGIIRPATYVPESKRLNILLNDFRANRNHLAMVVDEYGGIAGLVTIEDVLEEIVGDIDDEHDSEEQPNIKDLGSTNFAVDALTPIEEFNEYFESALSDDEFDTIGGIVSHEFGRLPKRDESIEIGKLVFRILNADDRRVKLLEVSAIDTK